MVFDTLGKQTLLHQAKHGMCKQDTYTSEELQLVNLSILQDQCKAMIAHCRFLLYLAFIPALVGLCSIPFVNNVPYTQKSELSTQPQLCTSGRKDDLHLFNNHVTHFAAQVIDSKNQGSHKPMLLFWCH